MVLGGGRGTRLQPLSYLRAKAAVPINGEALVHRVMRGLAASGIRNQVLNLHHHPASITSVVGDGSDLGVRVRYSCNEACFVRASVLLGRKTIGTATDSIDRAGSGKLRIRLTEAGRYSRRGPGRALSRCCARRPVPYQRPEARDRGGDALRISDE